LHSPGARPRPRHPTLARLPSCQRTARHHPSAMSTALDRQPTKRAQSQTLRCLRTGNPVVPSRCPRSTTAPEVARTRHWQGAASIGATEKLPSRRLELGCSPAVGRSDALARTVRPWPVQLRRRCRRRGRRLPRAHGSARRHRLAACPATPTSDPSTTACAVHDTSRSPLFAPAFLVIGHSPGGTYQV
jgi:hypothetical protein